MNCEINPILTRSMNCVIFYWKLEQQNLKEQIVTLLTQDNKNLLEQLKSGFKTTINWNKYQSKISTERQNQYLDLLIDPHFQVANRPFVLSFENEDDRNVHRGYYLPKVKLKIYNVMINGKNFFWTASYK